MRQGFWTSRVHLYDKGVLFHQRNPCQRCTKRCQQDLSVAARWKKTQRPKGFGNLTCLAQFLKCTSVWKICWTCSSTGNSSNLSTVPFPKSDKPLQTPTFWIVTKSLTSRFFSTAGSLVPLQIGNAIYTFAAHPHPLKPHLTRRKLTPSSCDKAKAKVFRLVIRRLHGTSMSCTVCQEQFWDIQKTCPNLESGSSEWRVFRISTWDLKKKIHTTIQRIITSLLFFWTSIWAHIILIASFKKKTATPRLASINQ